MAVFFNFRQIFQILVWVSPLSGIFSIQLFIIQKDSINNGLCSTKSELILIRGNFARFYCKLLFFGFPHINCLYNNWSLIVHIFAQGIMKKSPISGKFDLRFKNFSSFTPTFLLRIKIHCIIGRSSGTCINYNKQQ